jgi:hypothetical protein
MEEITLYSRLRMRILSEFEKNKKPDDAFIYWDDGYKVDNIFCIKQAFPYVSWEGYLSTFQTNH